MNQIIKNELQSPTIRESGWERWHDWQTGVFRPITSWFCDAIAAGPGQTVLDAACGTGLPAIAISRRVKPNGKVVAIDISAQMARATRRKARGHGADNIEVHDMDLSALAFPDACFDAVTCKDGLMFCPEPSAAAHELRRVLKPLGRFAISAWAELESCAFFKTMLETVARFVPRPPPDPRSPGPFRLSRPGELEAVLREAGFSEVAVERREVVFDFESPTMHWQVLSDMAAPVSAAIAILSAVELGRLRLAMADALVPYLVDGRVRLTNVALCASGRR